MLSALVHILFLLPGVAHADCLKVETGSLKTVSHQNKTYYADADKTYLINVGCLKSDASQTEVIQSLKKSGKVEMLSENRVVHTIQAQGASAVTVIDFGAENGQVTGVTSKLSAQELRKVLLLKIK